MSADNRYGVSEHKSGAGDGIVSHDKSDYIHKRFLASDGEDSESVVQEVSLSPDVTIIPDVPAESYVVSTSYTDDTEFITDDISPFHHISPEQVTSPTSVFDVGEVDQPQGSVAGFSFLKQESVSDDYSFNNNGDSNRSIVSGKTIAESKSKTDKVISPYSDTEVSDSYYVGTDKARAYADFVSTEQELQTKGISGADLISPAVDILREDETGGEVLADTYLIGTDTQKAVKYIRNAQQQAAQQATKKAAQKGAAQGVGQSASQTAVQTGVSEGSKKAVGQAVSKAVPPIVWLWVLIGVVVTLILFMIMSISSMAVTLLDNTELVLTDPYSKNAVDIVAWCKWAEANKHGYVYGAFGQMCTSEFLDRQALRYPGDDEAGGECREIGNQWIGKSVYDCIGLIKAYMWYDYEDDEIYYQTNDFPDCSANSIWDYIESGKSGTIDTIPEVPGIAVWVDGHIGVYIGDGEVIEAQSTETGVVKTNFEDGAWTHWLYIPHVEYPETTEPTTESE